MEIIIVALIVVAAVAAAVIPLVRRTVGEPLEPPERPLADEAAIEEEIARYRAALNAGTLCRRCGEPNPDGSRFCAACGRALGPRAA